MSRITYTSTSGCDLLDKAWVWLDGRRGVKLDRICSGIVRTDAELLAAAKRYWEASDAKDHHDEAVLRAKYPNKQIFGGPLPDYDVAWDGKPGWYTYVLKDRRKRVGHKMMHQVLEAI